MAGNKLLSAALLLSIALNLVFIGGIAYRASTAPEIGPRPFPPNVGWVVRDLSEERRAELEPVLRQSSEQIRPLRREMFEAQRRVNELIASSELDDAALSEAFAELRATGDRYQSLSHQQTILILEQLTEEERLLAREFMQRRGPRGRDGRGPGFGSRFGPEGPRGPGNPPPPGPGQ